MIALTDGFAGSANSLRVLDLSRSHVHSVGKLAALHSLDTLNLQHNQVSELKVAKRHCSPGTCVCASLSRASFVISFRQEIATLCRECPVLRELNCLDNPVTSTRTGQRKYRQCCLKRSDSLGKYILCCHSLCLFYLSVVCQAELCASDNSCAGQERCNR